jgi:hypothetical protein
VRSVRNFIEEDRVVHVYGSVQDGPLSANSELISPNIFRQLGSQFSDLTDFSTDFQPRKILLDSSWRAAKKLKTVDPHDKEDNVKEIALARRWIADSEIMYILGYGFDSKNSERIQLRSAMGIGPGFQGPRKVMFTNYGNLNVVNKAVSKLIYGSITQGDDDIISNQPDTIRERSRRDVYEAFEKDFGVPEDE